MNKLFSDMKTDEEKSAFFLSGRGYETGVIAATIQNDVAMAYRRCAEYKKEINDLRQRIESKESKMNINIIDKDTILVDGSLFKRAEGEGILICTVGGYQYFLGPEYDGEMNWNDARDWCTSLGEGYELPNRLVMLAICMNEYTSALLTTHQYYWTSTEVEDDISLAWFQYWRSNTPGRQGGSNKSSMYRVRAVRRRSIEGGGE